jgi:hypothetical protein
VDEPLKAPAARGKKRWQMSDLPHGMNDNEAWRKMLIPTVYWHFGNQRDGWIYDDDKLASDLGKIISAVYPSSLKQRVSVDGPIFRIVSVFFCHRRYGRDRETRSRECKSRAKGLLRLRVSLSSKFPPLLYVRETLQKMENRTRMILRQETQLARYGSSWYPLSTTQYGKQAQTYTYTT